MNKEDFEKEVAATVAELPFDPPEEIIGIMEERRLLEGDVLIYRAENVQLPGEERKKKMAKVCCTACGGVAYLEHVPIETGCHRYVPAPFGFKNPTSGETKMSGEKCLCPCCGEPVEAVHIGRFNRSGYYTMDSDYAMTIHNVRNHLCLLSWHIDKMCDKEGKIFFQPKKYEGAMVIGNKMVRVNGHQRVIGGFEMWRENWEARKRFSDEAGGFRVYSIMPFAPETVYGTESDKSALERLIADLPENEKIWPISYLKLWTKHQNVENLVRSGLSKYVTDVMKKCRTQKYYYGTKTFNIKETEAYIDWKKKKPHEMLHIEKEHIEIAKQFKIDTVKLYVWCREQKIRIDTKTLEAAEEIGASRILEIIQEPVNGYAVLPIRLINYMTRQRAAGDRNVSTGYIKDYWRMLVMIYGNMDPALIWPKSITKAHNDMVLRMKEKESKEINEKISSRLEDLQRFELLDNRLGLMIRPAASHAELIKEGKILHHCVASYAENHASGKTTIFFIRKMNDPERPFFTLEFKNDQVQQNRGDHNCARTPEVQQFEAKWMEYVKGVMRNGKRNRAKRTAASSDSA